MMHSNGNDVAGIGRVDAANFHNNATSAGILNISNPSSLDNGDYLLSGIIMDAVSSWASTGTPTDVLNLSYLRVAREWRADKTNDVGTVSITGDFAIFHPYRQDTQFGLCLLTVMEISLQEPSHIH